ncbi:MAG TPA: tetratricopeptide repeat protein [Chloroflexota bacterium]|nr:tetratricopeptide repeat protein [Chloroflexota bacterium]
MNQTSLPDLFDLWDYNDPAGTAVRFRELLPLAVQSGDTGYYLELLTQIARAEGLQSHFAEAHATLDEVETKLTPQFPIVTMRYLLERGRVFNSAGEAATAVPLFQQAYDLGQQTGVVADFFTVDAAHMLGIAVASPEEQLQWNLIALEQARRSPDKRAQGWQGSLLNNIGWTYFDAGAYEKALPIFAEAVTWRQTNKPDDAMSIRIANWSVARVLRALGRLDEALVMQQALLAEIKASGAESDGFVFEEIGECLLALGQGEAARPYFTQAYALLSQQTWLVNSEPARLERLARLGN